MWSVVCNDDVISLIFSSHFCTKMCVEKTHVLAKLESKYLSKFEVKQPSEELDESDEMQLDIFKLAYLL